MRNLYIEVTSIGSVCVYALLDGRQLQGPTVYGDWRHALVSLTVQIAYADTVFVSVHHERSK
jgi:hypothetical protein